MRIVVFGGRDYRRYDLIFDQLAHLRREIKVVMHGDAAGADTGADVWAVVNGFIVGQDLLRFPADWRPGGTLDKSAGVKRNQRIIDEGKPTHALMFPGGSGTADMRERLIKAKIPIRRGDV